MAKSVRNNSAQWAQGSVTQYAKVLPTDYSHSDSFYPLLSRIKGHVELDVSPCSADV